MQTNTRHELVQQLKRLRDEYGAVGVKAEFEAEGSRLNEVWWLRDIASRLDMKLGVKIGGCEAITDLQTTVELGADYVIAPMVETPYALSKYLAAILKYAPQATTKWLFNLETITAFQNLEEMLRLKDTPLLSGVVLGRVDLIGSLGRNRDEINHEDVLQLAQHVAQKARDNNLEMVVGGGVALQSMPFFQELAKIKLDRFETRKVVFDWQKAKHNGEDAFRSAVAFELAWLQYKQQHYAGIAAEDNGRIQMLLNRQSQQ